jgi:uncharacterized protein YjiS (DUF1127 family)
MLTNFFKTLAEKYRNWRWREQTLQELFALDDRSLADLGISRSEIPYVVSRIPVTVAPLEEKSHPVRHAA